MYGNENLRWNGDWCCLAKRKLIRVIPDKTYPAMWRVQHADGRLSDMVNRTRAKDAAATAALALLNR